MPAAVVHIDARRHGQYAVLQLALPAQGVHNIGILLLHASQDRLYLRLRDHWDDLAGPEDRELLAALDDDFRIKIDEMGGARFFESLEDCLSHSLRITGREPVAVDSFLRVLDNLYDKHVQKLDVLPYRTHLPLYSLRAAATRFGDDQQVEEEDWVRVPENIRLSENMFAAHVTGRSMEPRIPDGSLNLFRSPVAGSRQNKIVLVEVFGQLDTSARYTVKRYTSRKIFTGDDQWQHESICLVPLNPEFPSFELGDGEFRTIAEWVCALE